VCCIWESKLEHQGSVKLNDLKSLYNIGDAVLHLRRKGFPQVNEYTLVNDLKEIYHSIYRLFERDFGTRDPSMSNYKGLSKTEFNKFFYYSQALKSIEQICKYKGYDFISPSVPGVSLITALNKKNELIMNQYDLGYWSNKPIGDTVTAFDRFYHLTKYLGFDPLLFMSLDKNLEKSHRHHFLAVIFRKMSSYVQDHVLTTETFHRSYDNLFKEMGLRQSQAFIEGLLATMEDLIWLTDDQGKFKVVGEEDVKAALQRHLGSLWEKGWIYWTKGKGSNTKTMIEFRNRDLKEFNNRRKYVLMPDGKVYIKGFQKFLKIKFKEYYETHFLDVINLNPGLFLGSKQDFQFMNIVYIGEHRFDLSNLF
jgi:hypothetical protein